MARPCTFFNSPGGCRKGAQCDFAHEPSAGAGGSTNHGGRGGDGFGGGRGSGAAGRGGAPTWGGAGRGGYAGRGRGGLPMVGPSGRSAPQRVCRDYWATGSCARRMTCTFTHDRTDPQLDTSSIPAPSASPALPSSTLSAVDPVAATRPTTDLLFRLARYPTQGEVQRQLKQMGHERTRIDGPSQIYAFVGGLLGANEENQSWTENERNALRRELANTTNTNLLLRLGDILDFPTLVDPAGAGRPQSLSFEKGLLPFIFYLTSESVLKAPVTKEKNALYSVLRNNFEAFAATITAALNEYLRLGRVDVQPQRTAVFRTVTPMNQLNVHSLYQILKALTSLLDEAIDRWRDAVAEVPELPELVATVESTAQFWAAAIAANPPTFQDSLTANVDLREFVTRRLRKDIQKLAARVKRVTVNVTDGAEDEQAGRMRPVKIEQGIIGHLAMNFKGPGGRHDNDHASIKDIAVAPTAQEIVTESEPYLPANLIGAPHHLPADQPMERHLDIQFRLLREEAIADLRKSVRLILEDMAQPPGVPTNLSRIKADRGGVYRRDGAFFVVFTGARFVDFGVGMDGFEVSLSVNVPAGALRGRKDFWDSKSGLSTGQLVALIWEEHGKKIAISGVISSYANDIAASQSEGKVVVKATFFDREHAMRVPQMLQRGGCSPADMVLIKSDTLYPTLRDFLHALQEADPIGFPFASVLVPGQKEATVVQPPAYAQVPGWEWDLSSLLKAEGAKATFSATSEASVRAARETLRTQSRLDPSQADAVIDILTREVALLQGPPGTGKSYTGVELIRVLLNNKRGPILLMAQTNHALDALLHAVVDKKITSSIVRLGSRSKDQLINDFSLDSLEKIDSVPEAKEAHRSAGRTRGAMKDIEREMMELSSSIRRTFLSGIDLRRHLEDKAASQLRQLMNPPHWVRDLAAVVRCDDPWTTVDHKKGKKPQTRVEDVSDYLQLWLDGEDISALSQLNAGRASAMPLSYPAPDPKDKAFIAALKNPLYALVNPPPPSEIHPQRADTVEEDEDDGEISTAPASPLVTEPSGGFDWQNWSQGRRMGSSNSVDTYLSNAMDAALVIDDPPAHQTTYVVSESTFVATYGPLPAVPTRARGLDELATADVWEMSLRERQDLYAAWLSRAQADLARMQNRVFDRLVARHARLKDEHKDFKVQSQKRLLKSANIIGCTTAGAAKLASLIQGISPRIMLVEEAGQTLETHVLATLTKSIEHLILIGDPQQLRPSINNYQLSAENPRAGSLLYRFDVSLLERLAREGLPMSQLLVQRRMAPEVSSLIRAQLYPKLEDHALVTEYPHVRGMAENVYFLDHTNAEGGDTVTVSKHNKYEVDMIVDLVKYLLRQGTYNGERGIVVLCAYLGQLSKIRLALQSIVTVVVDQRDQDKLDLQGEEEGEVIQARQVSLSQQVVLRTVDNFQGEEGDVIILSTVRNHGSTADMTEGVFKSTIGFLKSVNRANVALSRARHGLYILGSAALLSAHSDFWQSVIGILDKRGQVGPGFPIECATHPGDITVITEPKQLPLVSPNGGCLLPCDASLSCGHTCSLSCHSDDPDHIAVRCQKPCQRLHAACDHPCAAQCYQDCPLCEFPVEDVVLPCGHRRTLPCHLAQNPESVVCDEIVEKELPCGHAMAARCAQDATAVICTKVCGLPLDCCSKTCSAPCNQCQAKSLAVATKKGKASAESKEPVVIPRTQHMAHPCGRPLIFCPHTCSGTCSADHECPPCSSPKVSVCDHGKQSKPPACSSLSDVCKEKCQWHCAHQGSCSLPCGSPCDRLPCDEPCLEKLHCGCPCPSICGESCPTVCLKHSPQSILEQSADLLLGHLVHELLSDENPRSVENALLQLPCGHCYTVESLDGHVSLSDFYAQDADGKWKSPLPPPAGFAKLATCPACRTPFCFKRYGRPIRKAALDVLEQNLVYSSSAQLADLSARLESIDESALVTSVPALAAASFSAPRLSEKQPNALVNMLSKALRDGEAAPISKLLTHKTAALFLGQPPLEAFKTVVRPLLNLYGKALGISQVKSSHLTAWQSAFAAQYRRLVNAGMEEVHALDAAKRALGLPPPLAKTRFHAEAVFLMINVRYALAQVAHTFAENMPRRSTVRHRWMTLTAWIVDSALQDAEMVLRTTADAQMLRYQLLSTVVVLRAKLSSYRFNAAAQFEFSNNPAEIRAQLAAQSESARQEAWAAFGRSFPDTQVTSLDGMDGPEWIEAKCQIPAETIMEEWADLTVKLRAADFFQAVTLEEKIAIRNALKLGHGRWYQCVNGHVYSVGECGGPMETAVCPECGSIVGGQHHISAAGNTPAFEFFGGN